MKLQSFSGALLMVVLFTSIAHAEGAPPEDPEAPLPAHAKRQVVEMRLPTNALRYDVSTIRLKGSGMQLADGSLATGVRDLLSKQRGVRVDETSLDLRIILESDVLFDFDSAKLRPEAEKSLHAVAEALEQFKGRSIRLLGHTDSKGDDGYNLKLSIKRADSVRSFLAGEPKLKGFQFKSEGRGEREPVAPNLFADGRDDPDGRQKNRRVEIRIPK